MDAVAVCDGKRRTGHFKRFFLFLLVDAQGSGKLQQGARNVASITSVWQTNFPESDLRTDHLPPRLLQTTTNGLPLAERGSLRLVWAHMVCDPPQHVAQLCALATRERGEEVLLDALHEPAHLDKPLAPSPGEVHGMRTAVGAGSGVARPALPLGTGRTIEPTI